MNITFETSNKPWFGPRKRARELLIERTHVLSPEEAVTKICDILGGMSDQIQRVRFIDYVHRCKQPFRYTIALLWIGPDTDARESIYERAEEVVRATGWYPLPQGERISSRAAERHFMGLGVPVAPKELTPGVGNRLISIQSAVGQEGGCCIRIITDKGSILLDTGLPGALVPEASDRVALLSHGHRDHSGGVISGACDSLPVVMSTATARLFAATRRVPDSWLKRQALLLDAGQEMRIGGITIAPFTVPHCPGSVGYVIRGADGVVVFTGDLALASARHDFVPALSRIVSYAFPTPCMVLLDGTMAGRAHGVTMSETANALLGKLSGYEDIAIISSDVEQLLYAFLDLFHTAKNMADTRAQIEFIATTELRSVFEIVHSAFIARQLDLLDPFLAAQYGESMSAWAESRWLYWLGPALHLGSGVRYKRIWFITQAEMSLISERGKLGLVLLGRLEGDTSVAAHGGAVLDLDSAVWTLHSNDALICDAVRQLHPKSNVVLFHNFEKRLRKFSTLNGLSCVPLSKAAILLSPT